MYALLTKFLPLTKCQEVMHHITANVPKSLSRNVNVMFTTCCKQKIYMAVLNFIFGFIIVSTYLYVPHT